MTHRACVVEERIVTYQSVDPFGGKLLKRRQSQEEKQMGKLAGKVAIVTGAAGGQGEAEVRLFAENTFADNV